MDKVAKFVQAERDYVATQLLRATLRELFEFRFMQSDPNFANFLYDSPSGALTLIDFGAAKTYPKPFVDDYLRMVVACAELDREGVIDASIKLGFLTGEESPVLLDAHARAGFQVGLPFASEGAFDFAEEIVRFRENRDMTRRVASGEGDVEAQADAAPAEGVLSAPKAERIFLACMRIARGSGRARCSWRRTGKVRVRAGRARRRTREARTTPRRCGTRSVGSFHRGPRRPRST